MAFTALAAIALIVAALLLLTGNPKVTLHTSGVAPHFSSPPAGSVLPPGPGGQVLNGKNLSAPVELILLLFAIAALGFAAWLWASSGRSRPPTAPA